MFDIPYRKTIPGMSQNSLELLGIGQDDFSKYVKLRDAKIAAGGAGDMLVSWPYDPEYITTAAALINQRLVLVPQIVVPGVPITGVAWIQDVAGAYTANNNNKIGAYTYDGANMIRVAQCATDGTIWKSAQGYQTKPFANPYTPTSDILWAAGIWNQSAVVTAPTVWAVTGTANQGYKNLGLNEYAFEVDFAAQTDLVTPIAKANLNNTFSSHFWLAFYHTY